MLEYSLIIPPSIHFLFNNHHLLLLHSEGVIEGHVSLINNYGVTDAESDDGYGQFVGHHSDEFLTREEFDVDSKVEMEGLLKEDSPAQILNTVLAAVSIIILSLLINNSEEIQKFMRKKEWWLSQ